MTFLFILFFATLPFQFALSPAPGVDLHVSRLFAIGLSGFWIVHSLFRRKLLLPASIETALLVSFLFFASFSLFFAENTLWGIRKLAFLFSFSPLFFVAFSVLQERSARERFAKWLVIGSAFSALLGIVQFLLPFAIGLDPAMLFWQRSVLPIFSGTTFSGVVSEFSSMVVNVGGINFLRASAFFPDPHIASFFWGMTFPFALSLSLQASEKLSRVAFFVLSITIFIADILTFSRGGYFAMGLASLVCFSLFFPSIFRKHLRALALSAILLSAVLLIPNPLSSRLFSSLDLSDHSTSSRLAIWSEALHIIAQHPLVGVGLGNYSNTVKPSADYREPRYAHNTFLDIAAETGIVNSVLFFLLLAFPIIRALKRSSVSLKFATGASLLIFSAHSLFETPLYSVHVLPLLLALIALTVADSETIPEES